MKENSKYKTIPRLLNYKPKYGGKGCERKKIKIIVPFCSYPMPNIKTPKQIAKKLKKIKKCHYGSIQSQNGLEKAEKE